MTVIIVYLLYTLYEADYIMRQSGDFYQDLGLTPGVEEKQVKTRFRRLAALQHPDPRRREEAHLRRELHRRLAEVG